MHYMSTQPFGCICILVHPDAYIHQPIQVHLFVFICLFISSSRCPWFSVHLNSRYICSFWSFCSVHAKLDFGHKKFGRIQIDSVIMMSPSLMKHKLFWWNENKRRGIQEYCALMVVLIIVISRTPNTWVTPP